MMNDLIKMVSTAVELEQIDAQQVHGDLHSKNEGYGVLAEEVEEVLEQIHIIEDYTGSLVRVIRYNLRELKGDLKKIKRAAVLAACECIQVASVAQRFIDLIDKEGIDEGVHDCVSG